jgi:hypothetical protein
MMTRHWRSLKGINNSLSRDVPGICLRVELNPAHASEFEQYVADPAEIVTLPVEFYQILWRDFADNPIANARAIPLKSSLIDASTIRNKRGSQPLCHRHCEGEPLAEGQSRSGALVPTDEG